MNIAMNGRLVLVLAVVGAAVAAGLVAIARDPAAGRTVSAPYFDVDPLWPKPMPNHWMLGSAVGVSVDERDHVWIVHRPASLADNEKGLDLKPPTGECCSAAPHVLEFDPDGTLVGHWGGPGQGYEWPSSAHGITRANTGSQASAGAARRSRTASRFGRPSDKAGLGFTSRRQRWTVGVGGGA